MDVPKRWNVRIDNIKSHIENGMGPHLPPGRQRELFRDVYYRLEGLQQMMEESMLLFPDMNRTQHEALEFCFAAPCAEVEWRKLYKHCAINHEWLPYHIVTEDEEKIALILRKPEDSDDDCLATGAYLRMVKEFTGMMYALPYATGPIGTTIASIIARTAGVPPHQVRHVEV